MGFLRIADTASVKRYPHYAEPEEGAPEDAPPVEDGYIECRAAVDKRAMNAVMAGLPDEMIERQMRDEKLGDDAVFLVKNSPAVVQGLFSALVTGWSLSEPPTLANYLALDPEAAAWIDGVLYGHWNSIQVGKDESGKPSTSPRGLRKGTRAKA